MWTSVNPMFRDLADDMNVEVGSAAWLAGGPPAYSGQTGGHAGSYGWNRARVLAAGGQPYVRAVFANYASRPCHYLDAPKRSSGYYIGGRPEGWKPEVATDLPGGEAMFFNNAGNIVKVSGPDTQHFWVTPLCAIADSGSDYSVVWNGKVWSAGKLATILLRSFSRSLAGQVRKDFKYLAGGRASATIMNTFCELAARGCVEDDDALLILSWIKGPMLAQLERAPGVQEVKGSGKCNFYQEMWLCAALYEAAKVHLVNEPDVAARVMAQATRLAQYQQDIEALMGAGIEMNQVRITDAMRVGDNGRPLPTLKGAIVPGDVSTGGINNQWSLRAVDVGRELVPGPVQEKFWARALLKCKALTKTLSDGCFMTDRNREFV